MIWRGKKANDCSKLLVNGVSLFYFASATDSLSNERFVLFLQECACFLRSIIIADVLIFPDFETNF